MSSKFPKAVVDGIERKTDGIVSARIAWESVAGKALRSGMPEEQLLVLLEAFAQSDILASYLDVCSLVPGASPVNFGLIWQSLQERVDDSQYSMESWLAALSVMLRYLKRHNRSVSLETILGYLSCSAEFTYDKGVARALPEVVEEMLNDFGFDG